MEIRGYTINAFAKEAGGGNPAGIVFDADRLSEQEMRKIAKKLGYSETAFVMKSNPADFHLRFFTTEEEVDLCGHATIGTFSAMSQLGMIKEGGYLQETKAGVLEVIVDSDHKVMMQMSLPEFGATIAKREIAESLNLDESKIDAHLPIQIVSTGLKDLIVPIPDRETVDAMQPDFEKIKQISQKYGIVGYHVFCTEPLDTAHTAYCRNFAPLYGIAEESATGTSNGALGCYLFHVSDVDRKGQIRYVMEQGYGMKRPSEIEVELLFDRHNIKDVKVGGAANDLSPFVFEL